MWKLNKVGPSVLHQYSEELIHGLRNRIVNGVDGGQKKLNPRDISTLIPNYGTAKEDLSILRHLLIDEPFDLYELCTYLMNRIIIGYDQAEFNLYLDNYKKKNLVDPSLEKSIVDKYQTKLSLIEELFDYEGQISHNADRSYWISRMKGSNTCTYCNRQYTFTIEEYDSAGIKKHIARPDLDHWFCKQMYPLMSLSFYNLIPSCHTCNSSAKSNILFSFETHIHPYIQIDDNPDIHFNQKLTRDGWSVEINRIPGSREDNTIKDLYILMDFPNDMKDNHHFDSAL